MGLWSHFDIYYGQYGSSNRWTSHQGTQTSFEIADPNPGIYIVEFLDSAMIRSDSQWAEDQSRDVLLRADTVMTTEPDPNYLPTIASISTDKGGNTGVVTVQITGGWLDPNATASLVHAGHGDIIAREVRGQSDCTGLTAVFDLRGREAGEWNLVVANPDGQHASSPTLFTIEQGGHQSYGWRFLAETRSAEGGSRSTVSALGILAIRMPTILSCWLRFPKEQNIILTSIALT